MQWSVDCILTGAPRASLPTGNRKAISTTRDVERRRIRAWNAGLNGHGLTQACRKAEWVMKSGRTEFLAPVNVLGRAMQRARQGLDRRQSLNRTNEEKKGMHTAVIEHEMAITKSTHDTTLGVLTQVLADEHVLYMKLRNYHWNVEGAHHRDYHVLFADQCRVIDVRIDEVAERMRALGAQAPGTMTDYLQRSTLREHPGQSFTAKEMLRDLLECHCEVIRFLRHVLAPVHSDLDTGSADLLTRLIQDHEKMAWVLRATLSDDRAGGQPRRENRSAVLYE